MPLATPDPAETSLKCPCRQWRSVLECLPFHHQRSGDDTAVGTEKPDSGHHTGLVGIEDHGSLERAQVRSQDRIIRHHQTSLVHRSMVANQEEVRRMSRTNNVGSRYQGFVKNDTIEINTPGIHNGGHRGLFVEDDSLLLFLLPDPGRQDDKAGHRADQQRVDEGPQHCDDALPDRLVGLGRRMGNRRRTLAAFI